MLNAGPALGRNLRAVIFVGSGPNEELDKAACIRQCQTNGWSVDALIVDTSGDGTGRMDAIRLLYERLVEVVVVADPNIFSGGGLPRLVIASNSLYAPPVKDAPPRRRSRFVIPPQRFSRRAAGA